MSMRKVIYIAISLSFAGGLMYYLFQGMDMNSFWEQAQKIEMKWFVYSMLIGIVAFVARGVRWSIQLEAEKIKVDGFRTFLALMSGYIVNLLLPRGGEVVRGTVLKRNTGISLPLLLGSILAERMLDLLILFVLLIFSLFIETAFFIQQFDSLFTQEKIFSVLKFILLFISVSLLMFFFFRKRLKNTNRVYIRKIMRVWINFRKGIYSVKKVPRKAEYVFYTVVIWLCYYLMTYIIIFSLPFDAHIPWYAGITFLVLGALGMSMPVQGGIGTYHAALATALTLYGFLYEQGLLLATMMHITHTLAVIVVGGISIIIINLMPKLKTDKEPKKLLNNEQKNSKI